MTRGPTACAAQGQARNCEKKKVADEAPDLTADATKTSHIIHASTHPSLPLDCPPTEWIQAAGAKEALGKNVHVPFATNSKGTQKPAQRENVGLPFFLSFFPGVEKRESVCVVDSGVCVCVCVCVGTGLMPLFCQHLWRARENRHSPDLSNAV